MDKGTKRYLICLVAALAIITTAVTTQPQGWRRLAGVGLAVVVFPVVPLLAQRRLDKARKLAAAAQAPTNKPPQV